MNVNERQWTSNERQETTMYDNGRQQTFTYTTYKENEQFGYKTMAKKGANTNECRYPRTTKKYERHVNTHMNPSLIQTHNKVQTFVRKYETKETYYENISY